PTFTQYAPFTNPTQQGEFLVITVGSYTPSGNACTFTVTDTAANNYTLQKSQNGTTGGTAIFSCPSANSTSGVTVHITRAGSSTVSIDPSVYESSNMPPYA